MRPLPPLLTCLLLVSTTAVSTPVFTQRFSAEYALTSGGALIGKSRWSLNAEGESELVYESESRAAGIARLIGDDHIIERSEWRVSHGHLRPYAYLYRRTGRKDKEANVSFDWDRGLANGTVKGKTWTMPVPDDTLDKLGYLLAMMHDLATGKRLLEYRIADDGKLSTYRLEAVAEEVIRTPLGMLNTVKIRRIRIESERETTFWCAPSLRFLPIKVAHKETDGSVILLELESIDGIELEAEVNEAG